MEKKKPAAEEDKVKDGRWRGNLPLEKIRQREEGCQGERIRDRRVRGTSVASEWTRLPKGNYHIDAANRK